MKFSWGKGIFAVYVLFMIVVLGTVAFTTTVDIDLVADDYYEQELIYQNEINKMNRTKELSEKVEIILEENNLRIVYPESIASGISGDLKFYRPSDQKLDFALNIKTDSAFTQIIPKDKLKAGLWKIKVDWKYSGIEYLNEKIMVVN
ncbi:MAG: FixH family protein [Bacteroidetes bacterium]|nr:FixH family protein [Bacteroidota bacterium]